MQNRCRNLPGNFRLVPRLILCNVSVDAHDVFVLCGVLSICEDAEIKYFTPIIKQPEPQIRVAVALTADCIDSMLHKIMQYMAKAEIGRVQWLQGSSDG